MSHRTKIQKELRKAGFTLVRQSKHFVYKNDIGQTIIVPNHNKMNEFTYRKIMKQVKGA